MNQVDEKTITIQTNLSINLLRTLANNIKYNPNKTLLHFFIDWQKEIGWDKHENYSILNQGVILTHLYGLIAYPKEIFNKQIPNIMISCINKEEWGNFKFQSFPSSLSKKDKFTFGTDTITNEDQVSLEFFIRKLRNSISHGRVKIYENLDFEFNDEDGTSIIFNISELQIFCEKFMTCYRYNKWN